MPKRRVAVKIIAAERLQHTEHAADGATTKDAKRMATSIFVSLLLDALFAALSFLQSQFRLATGKTSAENRPGHGGQTGKRETPYALHLRIFRKVFMICSFFILI
jgi:hypothetical protein